MSYTIEQVPDLPVVLIKFGSDFGGKDEMAVYTEELYATYVNLTEPAYQVVDLSEMKLSFDDVMNFIQIGVRGEHSVTRHPNNLGIALITTSRFYQMAVKGLNTASFGNLEMDVFDSIDAALAWVRKKSA